MKNDVTKMLDGAFYLNCIQNKNICISLIPKHATTNLIKFFVGTGPIGVNKDSPYGYMFENTPYDISQNKPLIVVTRNETERWCSGVVQELNEYAEDFLQRGIRKRNPDEMWEFLDEKATRRFCDLRRNHRKSLLFWGNSHSQLVPIWVHLMPVLMQRNNVYFTDISCLKTLSFWSKVCVIDSSFPPVLEWFDDWINMYLGNNHNKKEMYDNKIVQEMVRDRILIRKEFEFITDILDNNQRMLDYLKTTDRWLS